MEKSIRHSLPRERDIDDSELINSRRSKKLTTSMDLALHIEILKSLGCKGRSGVHFVAAKKLTIVTCRIRGVMKRITTLVIATPHTEILRNLG